MELRALTRRGARVTVGAFVFLSTPVASQSSPDLVAVLDSAARAHLESPTIPGLSVAVVRGGEVLLHRGYGLVDTEWNVPTPEDGSASYQIGSVTKQFTAAAVMLLVEESRVDLEADFTDYVGFDTGSRTVSVRRLLDHTSGIESYTDLKAFEELAVRDLPRDSLLRMLEAEDFDFEPGEALIYNNSGFFILGLIIEAVSGQTYEEFIQERLFEPAGMTESYYCDETAIRQKRAHGYDAVSPEELIRAQYIDHTWPFAAGSLCSTVGDLAKWNETVHGGGILRSGSYQAMVTPNALDDGTPLRYAMGVGVTERSGLPVISHGGGINGFLSQLAWYPDDQLTVVVLQNSTGSPGPGELANTLAELVLGPEPEIAAVPFQGDLGRYVGTYKGVGRGRDLEVEVQDVDGRMELRLDEQAWTPVYRGGERWVRGNVQLTFVPSASGVDELRFDSGGGHYILRRAGG